MRYNVKFDPVSISMNRLFSLIILIVLLQTTACTRGDGEYKLPGVYRINIQQGNIVDQSMIDRLKPGMPKRQVKIIMGTPTLDDTFHPNRWDYVYTYSFAGRRRTQRHLTVHFENDKLAYLSGDVKTSNRKPKEYELNSKIVDVPLRSQRPTTWFDRILNKIPFVGKKEQGPPKDTTNIEAGNPNPTAHQPIQTTKSSESGKDNSKTTAEETKPKKKGFFSRLLEKLPFVGDHKDENSSNSSGK